MFKLKRNLKKKWLASFAFITSVGVAVATTVSFSDDFASDTSIDTIKTTANLSTEEQAVYLAWSKQQQHRFPDGDTAGTDIGSESDYTFSIALGDIDNDGDLDVVAGNSFGENIAYLNDGGGFTTGTYIETVGVDTRSIALGDIDGDGYLDVVVGNYSVENQYYLNDGSGGFDATGTDIGSDTNATESIALGDIDGDGDLDVVAGNNSAVNKFYLNDGSGGFDATGTAIGSDTDWTGSIALGDIDGDGDLDVVVGNYFVENKYYLNDGSGGFNATGTDIGSDTNSTESIALGDIDNDGDLDVVAGNDGNNKLYLNDGSGGFDATGTSIGSELGKTEAIVLGDIDGDGDLDLVVGDDDATNKAYLNDGSGGFDATGTDIGSDTNYTQAIALGNIDGDGDLDLVVGNLGEINKLHINAGSGGFDATGTTIGSASDRTWSITLGDIDGDGDLDVVVGDSVTNKLYLNDGSGGFTAGAGTDIGSELDITVFIALGDIDGDGDLDVVAGNYGQTNKLYLNDGSGDFDVTGTDIGSDTDNTGSIALGDIDSDGDLDVVVGNHSLPNKFYLNDGSGGFTMGTGTNIGSLYNDTRSIALGDIDGDGDLDVVEGNDGRTNKLYLNDGSGGFTTGAGIDIGSSETHATHSIALGDIDGDGDLDVVSGGNGVNKFYLNDGSGGFDATGTAIGSDTDWTWSIALGDIDSDGDLDVVTADNYSANKYYLNDGSGGFGATGVAIGDELDYSRSIVLGDIDSDGDLDVVVGNDNQTNKLYIAKTRGVFPSTGTSVDNDADYTISIVFADVDRDGDLDVLVGNYDDTNKLYLNDGNDVFASSGVDIGSDSGKTFQIAVGDIDGDGDLDVVSGNDGNNKLYLNNAGVFDPGADIDSDGDETRAIALADLNGDGNLDVVTGNIDHAGKVYLNNGINGFDAGVVLSGVPSSTSVAIGDIDNDGDLDIVSGISALSTSKLSLNNGDGTFVTGGDIGTGSIREIALADIDGNGYLDLVVVNYNQNNEVYLNTTVVAASVTFDAGSDIGNETDFTVSLDVADVDADGDLDVIAGNGGQTNKLYLNDGSGVFPSIGVAIGTETDQSYAITAADVDGDGDIDIMAGNTSSTSANKLYKQVYHNINGNQIYSNKVNGSVTNIAEVTLTATATSNTATTRNTSIDYYVSNNGGDKWYSVKSGAEFIFPETGTDDIRWRAQLNSFSPVVTPVLSNIELSYTAPPKITGVAYNIFDGELTVTGGNFTGKTGVTNDIDASTFTFTGEASASYALTDTADVDITSSTEFTLTLSAADKVAVNALINKNGTTSTDSTVYNLAVAEDWNAGAKTSLIIADSTTPITASNINEAPAISGVPAVTVAEDASYSFIPTVTDVNTGDTKTFSITNKPSWATFNTATGALTGTPDNDDIGTTTGITITVADSGGLSASLTAFDIAVTNVNDAPTITGTPATTVAQGFSYSFTPTAADVDTGDTITFSITNKPSWATFSATTGALTGTPTNSNVGTTTGVVITVTDSAAASTSLSAFTIIVTNTNDAPTISGAPTNSVAQGASYSFIPTVTDVDTGDSHSFSITNKPDWATFSTATGALTGAPDNDDVGTTTGIIITVTDSATANASLAAFDITVTNTNDEPSITGSPATTAAQGLNYSFTPAVTDVDAGDTTTFSIANKPSWATFNAATGALTGTPDNSDIGTTNNIVITVTDSDGLSASLAAFNLVVTNTNDAPVITGMPITTVAQDANYSFTPAVMDVDAGDIALFSIVNKPDWATFNTATGVLTGTPNNGDVGTTNNIVITATDSGGLSASLAAFNLVVTNINEVPVITGAPATTATQGGGYSFTPAVTDVDAGDTTTFSIANKPSWATFNAATGALTGTPDNSDIGTTNNIVITVTDSDGLSASLAAFNLVVTNTNDAPVITGMPITTVAQDVNYSFTPAVTDVDAGDIALFSIVNKPDWATFNTATGALTGTPSNDYVGTINDIVITATDSGGLSASLAAFNLEVTNINDAPEINGTPATTVAQAGTYGFIPTVTDIDVGDTKTFNITNKPSWATFNTATGALTGTPNDGDIGTTDNIVITVTDSGGLSASLAAFDIKITSTAATPVTPVTPPPPTSDTTTTVTVTNGSKGGSMGAILIALMGLVLYRVRRQQQMS